MNKNDFIGWKEVFFFTFQQTVKQKAYVIFLVIFSVIALFYSTGSTLLKQALERKEIRSEIGQIVIFDETGLDIEYTGVFTSKKYQNIPVMKESSKPVMEYEKQMKEQADKTMLIRITFDAEKEKYQILFTLGTKINMSEIAKEEFSEEFCDYFEKARFTAVNLTKEQQEFIQTDIETDVKELSETGEIVEKAKGDGISFREYIITLVLLVVCMMLMNLSGNQIALSIVTEKSNRVMEYLMLNIRPLALIVGKLTATIVTTTLQMLAVGFGYIASPVFSSWITPKLSQWLFGTVEVIETNETMADEALAVSIRMIHGIRIEFVLVALLFIILGIIFYGLIAGLLGASVSKMDEMQEAMSLFQIFLVFGCYADMALCVLQISGSSVSVLNQVLSICPITSPFLVPANLLLGKMSVPLMIISILVMIVSIILLFALTAAVYEALIFYQGQLLKIKDILSLASSKRKIAKKEESIHEK